MARNKGKAKTGKRQPARVFVGDPGPPKPESATDGERYIDIRTTTAEDLDQVETKELLRMALMAGIDPQKLLGVDRCYEHYGNKFKLLSDRPLHSGFKYSIDMIWCRNCWQWFRNTKPLEE